MWPERGGMGLDGRMHGTPGMKEMDVRVVKGWEGERWCVFVLVEQQTHCDWHQVEEAFKEEFNGGGVAQLMDEDFEVWLEFGVDVKEDYVKAVEETAPAL